jgi:hypothetical protein
MFLAALAALVLTVRETRLRMIHLHDMSSVLDFIPIGEQATQRRVWGARSR